jgi:hypothetical protein
VTAPRRRGSTLDQVAVFEVVYLVAAILWIVVVTAAAVIGLRVMLKVRARRRRVNQLLSVVRLPVALVLAASGRRR